jgi:hypothetical protein
VLIARQKVVSASFPTERHEVIVPRVVWNQPRDRVRILSHVRCERQRVDELIAILLGDETS